MKRVLAVCTLVLALAPIFLLASPLAHSAQTSPAVSDPALLQVIKTSIPSDGSQWGVVVKNLVSGQTATINADTVFVSASLYKLTVMYEAYRQQRAGTFTLNAYNRAQVRAMITLSDNASAWSLFSRLGQSRINATMREIGLPRTLIGDPTTTTPREMATFMEMIYREEAVDASASREMLNLLLAQQVNDRLPYLLPARTPVAHKTGNLGDCVHDVGIVYAPKGPYIIAVLVRGSRYHAQTAYSIANVSRAVYDYFDAHQGEPAEQSSVPSETPVASPTSEPESESEPAPPSTSSASAYAPQAETRSVFFPETGHYIGGPFLRFFEDHGGIEIFGYPLTEAFEENGLTVQYFQRQRLEWWPENPEPYKAQLTLIGDEVLGPGAPPIPPQSTPGVGDLGRRYYAETGHTLADPFKQYFDKNGGLDTFGYPTSEQLDASGVVIQRFQRGRMEFRVENPDPFKVQLALLGYQLVEKNGVPAEQLEPRPAPSQ